jgi:hypothetical protein
MKEVIFMANRPKPTDQKSLWNDFYQFDGGYYGTPTAAPTAAPKPSNYETWLAETLAKYQNMSGPGGGGSASNYFGQAQNMLGGLDTSGFAALKDSYNQMYATGKEGLDTSYQNLLGQLDKQLTEGKQQFGAARGTIMEDSFGRNRDAYRNLASRGLGASGLQQLAGVQNRMETGRQVSNVAGQFYDASEKIADTKAQGTQQHALQAEGLSNQLAAQLSGLNQQEIEYKNAYQQQVAQLAMQMQQQAAQAAMAKWQAQQAQMEMEMNIGGELAKLKDSRSGGEMMKYDIAGSDAPDVTKVAQWMDTFGVDEATAKSELAKYGSQYEGGLKEQTLSTLDPKWSRMSTKEDFNSAIENVRDMYQSGAMEMTDVVNYLSKHSKYIYNKDLSGVDFTKPRNTTERLTYDAINKLSGRRKEDAKILYVLYKKGVISSSKFKEITGVTIPTNIFGGD